MYLARHRLHISRLFVLAILLLLLGSAHSWQDSSLLDVSMEYSGLALIIAGTFGRIWSYLYICGRKTDELVTVGPYSITRNPLYLFSLIAAIGIGLASENLLVLGLILLLFGIIYPVTIKAEEKDLARLHGDAFWQYKHAVPRFFPRTLELHQPERYSIHLHQFGRVFFDAMWFVWLFIVMEVIEKLHESQILPVFLHVP